VQLESLPSRSDHVVARRGADAVTVLLDTSSGEYYALDDVGGRIWELCDGSQSVTDIATALAAEYDAPLDQIRADVVELLDDLAADGLVGA